MVQAVQKKQSLSDKANQDKRKKLILLLFFIVLLLLVMNIIFLFVLGVIPLPSFFKDFKAKTKLGEKLVKEKVFKVKKPKPIEELKASKIIKAQEGGRITVTDPNGVEITLFIPPGGLDEDQEISLVPLEEPPAEDFDDDLGNGVIIEPDDIDFNDPAVLIFDFNPQAEGIALPMDFDDLQTPVSASPSPEQETALADNTRVVFVDHDEERVDPTDSQLSHDNTQAHANIDTGGVYQPTEADEDEADGFAQQGPRSGAGLCSDEYFQYLWETIAYEQATGQTTPRTARSMNIIQECLDEKLKELERKCQENKMLLRRKDFLILLALFQRITDTEEKIVKLRDLMNGCEAKYEIKTNDARGIGGYAAHFSIISSVCGYVDDQWQGEQSLGLIWPDPPHTWNYVSSIRFTLPSEGGEFEKIMETTVSGPISYGWSGTVSGGYFNNKDEVNVYYYYDQQYKILTKIEFQDQTCNSSQFQDFTF